MTAQSIPVPVQKQMRVFSIVGLAPLSRLVILNDRDNAIIANVHCDCGGPRPPGWLGPKLLRMTSNDDVDNDGGDAETELPNQWLDEPGQVTQLPGKIVRGKTPGR